MRHAHEITYTYKQSTINLLELLTIYHNLIIRALFKKSWMFAQTSKYEPVHEVSNNVVCVTSKATDLSRIRAV